MLWSQVYNILRSFLLVVTIQRLSLISLLVHLMRIVMEVGTCFKRYNYGVAWELVNEGLI